MEFCGGGADDLVGDAFVGAVGEAEGEGFFDAAVFAGVESEDGEAAPGEKGLGEVAEEGIEGGEFFVDRDAEGLEDAAAGEFAFRGVGGEGVEGGGEAAGGGEGISGEGAL